MSFLKIMLAASASVLLLALITVTLLRVFVQGRFCPSNSMSPTLAEGDKFLTERWSVYRGELNRGDIVVFYLLSAQGRSANH